MRRFCNDVIPGREIHFLLVLVHIFRAALFVCVLIKQARLKVCSH